MKVSRKTECLTAFGFMETQSAPTSFAGYG